MTHHDDEPVGGADAPPEGLPTELDPIEEAAAAADRSDVTLTALDAPSAGGGGTAQVDLSVHERYAEEALLGEGGMGEVHLCRDRVIGRSIARKTLRADAAGAREARRRELFLREAQVQGQLEHPAVVPVYDVGREDDRLWFTMKRVSGQTLEHLLWRLQSDDEARRRFGRHRLLSIFQVICQCVDYAHARGVVHRDIKPANVMIGDFGEVYLLDWGVARVGRAEDGLVGLPDTQSGVGGTLGYMPPEQLTDEASVDVRSDVYALGAILFELLTLEHLHVGDDAPALVASTRRGADTRMAVRCPEVDVPPELEAICARATALSPDDRYASVEELSEEVERFLEGDRDLALRRDIARGHVEEARRLESVALGGEDDAVEARKRALSELGRALAVRPDDPEATQTLRRILTAPPERTPPEVREAMEAQLQQEARSAGRLGGYLFGVMAISAMVLSWAYDVAGLATNVFIVSTAAGAVLAFASQYGAPRPVMGILSIVLAGIATATTSVILGPLVLTPVLAVALAVTTMSLGQLARLRGVLLAVACLAVAVPALLEATGVVEPSYISVDGGWLIRSKATEIPADRSYPWGLFASNLLAMICASVFVWRLSARVSDLRRRLHLHSWQLSHLAPEQARGAVSEAPPAP